jgi:hypothetical protein
MVFYSFFTNLAYCTGEMHVCGFFYSTEKKRKIPPLRNCANPGQTQVFIEKSCRHIKYKFSGKTRCLKTGFQRKMTIFGGQYQ